MLAARGGEAGRGVVLPSAQFDSDRPDPGTFGHFVATAVVVESLIRSDAWAALQQSLTETCQ